MDAPSGQPPHFLEVCGENCHGPSLRCDLSPCTDLRKENLEGWMAVLRIFTERSASPCHPVTCGGCERLSEAKYDTGLFL